MQYLRSELAFSSARASLEFTSWTMYFLLPFIATPFIVDFCKYLQFNKLSIAPLFSDKLEIGFYEVG